MLSSSSLPILTELSNKNSFQNALDTNPGIIIIKFGAEWCGPCKKIEGHVKILMSKMPNNVQCYIIDIDNSLEIYSFLKNKKMVNGIPVILAYYSDNTSYIPDDAVIGSDAVKINEFFERSYKKALE
jgi:thiol-disulfide isomerase/thioredoxin